MSIQCSLTNSVVWLIISRLLQGAAGAFMVPVARLLLLKTFAKEDMIKAYTLMGMPVLLGPILAPIIGGYLVTYLSWRYIFWVNVPLGLIALIATIKYIENYRQEQEKFNLFSYLFLALFLAGVYFWLDICLITTISFNHKLILFICALVCGLVYYLIESKSQFPVVRYRLFKLRTFCVCFFSSILIRAALGGRAFILAIFLEVAFHLSAFKAGFFFIFMSLGILSSRSIIRKALNKFGFRRMLTYANTSSFIVLLMFCFICQIGPLLYITLFLTGVFASAQFSSINILYYAEVETVDYGSAVSLANTWQQLGISLGVIIAAWVLHIFNQLLDAEFSIAVFHFTFLVLAFLNLSCQLLISRLQPSDGQNLLAKPN